MSVRSEIIRKSNAIRHLGSLKLFCFGHVINNRVAISEVSGKKYLSSLRVSVQEAIQCASVNNFKRTPAKTLLQVSSLSHQSN